MTDEPVELDDEQLPPSKSQLKREALALQDLGERLVGLSPARLARLGLSERLMSAVEETRKITSHSARKRQIRWLAKVIAGEDTEQIRQVFQVMDARHDADNQRFHTLERWRNRLLEEGDSALPALLERYPRADRQQLRMLIRTAEKEREQEKPAAAARRLFKYLRQLDEAD
jgi:ribosome-associated protein